jgi:predicted nucleic acid-binding protein
VILLDTNIVSEVMKAAPAQTVTEWLNARSTRDLFICTVTIGAIEYGLRILPEGKRRTGLKNRFERFVSGAFGQRVLGYDETAARRYGEIMGLRREMGRPMSMADGQIAAIALAAGFALATRNTRDFAHCGLELLDPFVQ